MAYANAVAGRNAQQNQRRDDGPSKTPSAAGAEGSATAKRSDADDKQCPPERRIRHETAQQYPIVGDAENQAKSHPAEGQRGAAQTGQRGKAIQQRVKDGEQITFHQADPTGEALHPLLQSGAQKRAITARESKPITTTVRVV